MRLGSPLPSRESRIERGKTLRTKIPRADHAAWKPGAKRPDPVRLLKQSSEGRVPELIPIRYGRMLVSPFTFYRGAALHMAADLASMPATGLRVQACGDCHLMNFGAFATPERRVIFDINDLDETLPAPWEWDLKRLTVSFVLAARDNGLSTGQARDMAVECAQSYREKMAEFADLRALEVWYASIDIDTLATKVSDRKTQKRLQDRMKEGLARRVAEHDFPKLVSTEGGTPVIRDNPPLIYHMREHMREGYAETLRQAFTSYRESLPEHRRVLLDRYRIQDIALKVVGVGSVGRACGILLLMADESDPLFLQVKEAAASVLEPYAGASRHQNHGQRVVYGCHLMQSASDLFLGWTEGQRGRHFYIRQLRDVKIGAMVETFGPQTLREYADVCGWALARAHARSGDPCGIAGYLGKGDVFDQAVADFSMTYADQVERDYQVLTKAVRAGKLPVERGA
ncbi:MAG TPA: DUF2252 domain-containing protein [Candidatus Eisenbacteria bacterium]|nr:DUF2252 domain-containing protein [Candidatus Eisenbacteria bacterium]